MTDIKRADKLLRNFRRRLAADKIVWVLVGLVVLGIAVVIIVSAVNPEVKENLNLPDIIVPDTQKIKAGIDSALSDMGLVQGTAAGGGRRRLRPTAIDTVL